MLRSNHIRWLAHVGCMEEVRILKQILFRELKQEQCKPKQRWKDNVRGNMKKLNIDEGSLYKDCQEGVLSLSDSRRINLSV